MINQYDEKQTYCRQLGHHVPFKYCRLVQNGLPCKQIFNCWFEIFPVKEFVLNNYSRKEIETILTPAPSRLNTILDIAAKIYKQREKTDS
ncbi:MAG: hypothetical protein JXB88_13195 [Spirochaetales bacterium]|nr:hypothetical protein [Spirochaetales bacterium]